MSEARSQARHLSTYVEMMMNKKMTLSVVALFLSTGLATAADQAPVQNQVQAQQTVGRKLMTDEERSEQRTKMQSAASREEKEKIRAEHHEKMKERAKKKGVTLPDNPPAGGMGGGRMGGMGQGGMGGGGMGQGGGMNGGGMGGGMGQGGMGGRGGR